MSMYSVNMFACIPAVLCCTPSALLGANIILYVPT